MSRPLRIEFPGALYHVTSRGSGRRRIFLDDGDREAFLSTLAWVVNRFGWICHAYCLLDSHYHLVIETPQPNLSRGMRQLNGVYTQDFNQRHRKTGHLFQGRFKAILFERDSYLMELVRYVALNPVRVRAVKTPGGYRWSSYRATAGLERIPDCLSVGWILARFAKTKALARKKYGDFVLAGIGQPSPWQFLRGQVLLGGDQFVARFAPQLTESGQKEKARRKQLAQRPGIKKLFSGVRTMEERNRAMARAHLDHGYTLAEIGDAVGLHYATVSRIIKAVEGMP